MIKKKKEGSIVLVKDAAVKNNLGKKKKTRVIVCVYTIYVLMMG